MPPKAPDLLLHSANSSPNSIILEEKYSQPKVLREWFKDSPQNDTGSVVSRNTTKSRGSKSLQASLQALPTIPLTAYTDGLSRDEDATTIHDATSTTLPDFTSWLDDDDDDDDTSCPASLQSSMRALRRQVVQMDAAQSLDDLQATLCTTRHALEARRTQIEELQQQVQATCAALGKMELERDLLQADNERLRERVEEWEQEDSVSSMQVAATMSVENKKARSVPKKNSILQRLWCQSSPLMDDMDRELLIPPTSYHNNEDKHRLLAEALRRRLAQVSVHYEGRLQGMQQALIQERAHHARVQARWVVQMQEMIGMVETDEKYTV